MDNTTAPANTAPASGNWFDDVTKNLLGLVSGGVDIYNKINNKTGGAASAVAAEQGAGISTAAKSQPTSPAAIPAQTGVSTQLLWLLGGAAVVLGIMVVSRGK